IDRLERFSDRIISCRVAVEAEHRDSSRTNIGVKVEVAVPGNLIVSKRAQKPRSVYDNNQIYPVIREAFDAAVRQLEDDARKVRREVKTHDGPNYGRVT